MSCRAACALTGVSTGVTSMSAKEVGFRRAQRTQQQPLSLVICDIDYFKRFNDTCGHVAGDDACAVSVLRWRTAAAAPAMW